MFSTQIISSLLLGFSLARIVSDYLVNKLKFNFFSTDTVNLIPGFSIKDSVAKTFDYSYILFTILFSVVIYSINLFFIKKQKLRFEVLAIYFIFSLLIFSEVHFVAYSGIRDIVLVFLIQVFFLIQNRLSLPQNRYDFYAMANGLFVGFYLLVFTNLFTTSFAIPIGLMFCTPFIFLLFSNSQMVKSLLFVLLPVAALFPFNKTLLLCLGVSLILGSLMVGQKIKIKDKTLKPLYISLILLIVLYNPLYYFGSFDSIEEGFWLGWLERLINGEVIYKSFYAYHPPLILWAINLFSKIFGYSIHNLRAILHILQIVGILIVYFVSEKIIKNSWVKLLIFWIILSVLTTTVRNNVEIRLGLGLLATFPIYHYLKSRKPRLLFASGVISGISVFTSIEVGVIACTSIGVFLFFENIKNLSLTIKKLISYILGVFSATLPIAFYLQLKGSLMPFINQTFYYTKAFSEGYLNTPVAWSENLSLLQWHVVNRFISSSTILWYISVAGILAALMTVAHKTRLSNLKRSDKYAVLLIIFSLLMLRPVLGRSDSYHLLFVAPTSLILFSYFLEKNFRQKPYVSCVVILVIALFFLRDSTQLGFMQNQLIKFQAYANAEGQYPSYKSDRTGILVGIDIDTNRYDEMIDFVKEKTIKTDYIFSYPALPEIYFLADRKNSTSFDTPLAYYTPQLQKILISQLKENPPRLIVYNPNQNLSSLNAGSLPEVKTYIENNFSLEKTFNDYQILVLKTN